MQRLYIKKQRGVMTLLISVAMLTLLGIVTLYTVKVNVMDQRMVANEADYQEAFTMAEAGLDFAVQQLFTDVFNNRTSEEHIEDSIRKRKTDGSPASETEAGFTVKIGCKRGDADEIVPCSDDAVLRSPSTYIKDGSLADDYAPTEIKGAPIYDIESTGYSANGSSEVIVRRQVTREPILNGVSLVSLIVDGDIHTGGGSYHIRPSDSGDEPLAIWASGEVIMRGYSSICAIGGGGRGIFRPCYDDRSFKLKLKRVFDININKLRIGGAGDNPNLPDRICDDSAFYAQAGVIQLYDLSNFTTVWTGDCQWMHLEILTFVYENPMLFYDSYGRRYGDPADFRRAISNSNTHENRKLGYQIGVDEMRTRAIHTRQTIEDTTAGSASNRVVSSSSTYRTRKIRPGGGASTRANGKGLTVGDTMLRSYDTSNEIYRAILPYARDFAAQPFPEDLFEYTFGVPRADWKTIRDKAEKHGQLRENCADLIRYLPTTSSAGDEYALWWITGDCSMPGWSAIGTKDKPVVLVIDDAQLITRYSHIYGRVFLFDNPSNDDKPSAIFSDAVNAQTTILGGLTSDVDDIEIAQHPNTTMEGGIGNPLFINSYHMNKPQPALAKFSRRNYDLIDIPGSWRDY